MTEKMAFKLFTAKQRIVESEKRYKMSFSAVNNGLWDWYVTGGNAYFSKQYYSPLGYEDGEWLWLSTRGKAIELNSAGNALRMIGTLSSITERKLVEKLLKDSEVRYRRLFESAQDGIAEKALFFPGKREAVK